MMPYLWLQNYAKNPKAQNFRLKMFADNTFKDIKLYWHNIFKDIILWFPFFPLSLHSYL